MKLIGSGWQYRVFDLGNGRVLKKFHSPFRSYFEITKTIFPFNKGDSLWMIPSFSRSMKRKAVESFEMLKRKNIPSQWFGNPKFLNGLDFEQDKVRPLHKVFENSGTNEIKTIIDKFVDFNKKLLEIGVIDKSFNITKNYGLNDDNEMILIDIGELFDDPKKIRVQRLEKAWDKSYVAGCIKDEKAQEYFIARMNETFGLH